jgi:hypothetical protein
MASPPTGQASVVAYAVIEGPPHWASFVEVTIFNPALDADGSIADALVT